MKILFAISHLTHDGPVHALHSIIEGFYELGNYEIVVLTLSAPHKDVLRLEFARLGIRLVNIPVNTLCPFFTIAKVRRFLMDENFDAAVSTCIRADAILAFSFLGLPPNRLFTTVQNIPRDDLCFTFPGLPGRLAAWLHYQVLRMFGNRIICVSGTIREHLHVHIGANGICLFNPVRANSVSREAGSSEPVIVYAASLSARKNPEEAIDFVVRSLPARPYRYDVYGVGPLEAALRERYHAEEKIRWLGFSDNLSQVFARSSVYVSSSLSEGLPLTPQLALICGCPCVLSDIPQHRELAELSRFVYLYRAGDQADFARALKSALCADTRQAFLEGLQLGERVSPRSIASQLHDIFNLI